MILFIFRFISPLSSLVRSLSRQILPLAKQRVNASKTSKDHLVEILWLTLQRQLAGPMLTSVSISEEHGIDVSHGDAENVGNTAIDIGDVGNNDIGIGIVLLLMLHVGFQNMLAAMIAVLFPSSLQALSKLYSAALQAG